MTEKKKITRTSWKAEAERLTELLAQACAVAGINDLAASAPEVASWWENYQDTSETRQAELKARALAKLTAEERAALGMSDA